MNQYKALERTCYSLFYQKWDDINDQGGYAITALLSKKKKAFGRQGNESLPFYIYIALNYIYRELEYIHKGSHHAPIVQYFTVPLPFLQESSGILRNPQEWDRNPQEWDWNGTGIEWNKTRKSIHLYTTDIIPLSDTFTLICLHTVTSRISTLCLTFICWNSNGSE